MSRCMAVSERRARARGSDDAPLPWHSATCFSKLRIWISRKKYFEVQKVCRDSGSANPREDRCLASSL
jgi:hypothetical protein